MTKSRRLLTSRSERFLGSFGFGQERVTANGSPEFGEDEVWSMIEGTVNGSTQEWSSSSSTEDKGSFIGYRKSRPLPPVTEHRRHHAGGISLAFDDSNGGRNKSSLSRIVHQIRAPDNMADSPRRLQMATSAPVNVPDWSKIYRVDSVESLQDWDDEPNDDSELVPPHEYLARSRSMAANSVVEGVGRTLKGRDLSRVRDAVWSQTGFYG